MSSAVIDAPADPATHAAHDRPVATTTTTHPRRAAPAMGYQPGLDGLRAFALISILLYHAGFEWMSGAFISVDLFFLLSGFLITALLLGERENTGGVDLGQFWLRRARRLFPALFAMLLAISVWIALWGNAEQVSQAKREIPWALFYVGNWGQILGDTPYFAPEPSMFRHLWTLAVEEQWYLIWPLAFVALTTRFRSRRTIVGILLGAAIVVWLLMAWFASGGAAPLGGPPATFEGADRTNFMYLSTITRSGSLLVGAALAFVWRPWRSPRAAHAPVGRYLDPLAAGTATLLVCIFASAQLTATYTYQWLIAVGTMLSAVVVMAAVHPAAAGFRRIMSMPWLVAIGKRSYGLYLWSWPISVIVGATDGSVVRFVWAMLISVAVSEVVYKFIETPVRQGELGRWWKHRAPISMAPVVGGALLLASLLTFFVSVDEFDPFVGGETATFDATTVDGEAGTDAVGDEAPGDAPAAAVPTVVPTTATLAIVGDSQANALAINLPDGISTTFPTVYNGSVPGCGVYDSGTARSAVDVNNNFVVCQGWQDDWAYGARGADVALAVVGGWDVFDVVVDGQTLPFASPELDARFDRELRTGVDAMLAEGVNVGLLEQACMRPVSVAGAGVPALPERGSDARVDHVNNLLIEVADSYGPEVAFIDGPDEWCTDDVIANDVNMRWDGVHVYQPGAKLIMESIAGQLLELAAV
ncbi:MAG: acyltransferase family protein [Actinomycetota bacterium]